LRDPFQGHCALLAQTPRNLRLHRVTLGPPLKLRLRRSWGQIVTCDNLDTSSVTIW